MIKNLIKIILILIIYLASCYYIYKADKLEEVNDINNNDINQNIIVNKKIKENKKIEYNSNIKDDSIGQIIIKKININRKLYNIDNPKNNIEENITILKGSIEPDKEESIIFVAAHSGYGEKAFRESHPLRDLLLPAQPLRARLGGVGDREGHGDLQKARRVRH